MLGFEALGIALRLVEICHPRIQGCQHGLCLPCDRYMKPITRVQFQGSWYCSFEDPLLIFYSILLLAVNDPSPFLCTLFSFSVDMFLKGKRLDLRVPVARAGQLRRRW